MSKKPNLEVTYNPRDHPCPRCGEPVVRATMTGPTSHVLDPCGCRVSTVDW